MQDDGNIEESPVKKSPTEEFPSAEAEENVNVEIDLNARTLRAEGPRDFVEEQIRRFNKLLEEHPRRYGRRGRGRPRLRPDPAEMPELVLEGTQEAPPLEEWFSPANPRSNYQRCALFIYYLKNVLDREPIIHEDVCACFRHLDLKPPANIQVCLSEAKRKYGFVEMPGNGTVLLKPEGVEYVENEINENG